MRKPGPEDPRCRRTFDALAKQLGFGESSFKQFESAWEAGEWRFSEHDVKDDRKEKLSGRYVDDAEGGHVVLNVPPTDGGGWVYKQRQITQELRALLA